MALKRKAPMPCGTRRSKRLQGLPPTPFTPTSQDSEVEAQAESYKPKQVQLANQPQRVDNTQGANSSKQSGGSPSFERNSAEGKFQNGPQVEALKQDIPPSYHQLSEENLLHLRIINGEDLHLTTNSPISRRSASWTYTGVSEQTSSTAHFTDWAPLTYRSRNLGGVQIEMYADVPNDIQAAIDHIMKAKVTSERRNKIHNIAQEIRDQYLECVKSHDHDAQFADVLIGAIPDLGGKRPHTSRKFEWRPDLKPIYQGFPRFGFVPNVQQRYNTYFIEDVRPAISIGIKFTDLVSALSSPNFSATKARDFLEWLQEETEQPDPEEPLKPILNPSPGEGYSHLTFPFAVIECYDDAGSKRLFEAQNSASVAAACGHKIQLDLDKLAACDATSLPPIFFTICAKGPVLELWAHWTVIQADLRRFQSTVVDACNALFQDQAENFMISLNNIIVWGLGPFKESVVKRLKTVAEMYSWA